MSAYKAEDVAQRLLEFLPADGTPVLNRVMRVMLTRALETPITPELYFKARDILLDDDKVGRLRGQGGQVFLAPPKPPKSEKSKAKKTDRKTQADKWPEVKLMAPFGDYLESGFRPGLDLPKGSVCLIQDTSTIGPYRGQWARPDYILISAMRFRFMPGSQVDVHSFELKTETGCTVQSIHEALAQTRFTHFGHLVWHLPEGSAAETRLAEIQRHCGEHGVGLIRMRDPRDIDAYEILLDPSRKPTLPATIEGFLETRLSKKQLSQLAKAVHGTAP